ncbi:hypothetical protein ACHWQZ_G001919 [Mnemiopsis leidyi]
MSKNQIYPSTNNAKEKLLKDSDQENHSNNMPNNQQNLQVTHPDAVKPSQESAVSPKDWETIRTLTAFKSILKEKKHTLLIVIFTAEWCRPCHQMNFALPNVIQMFPEVLFYKIDVDENLETANTYSIACVPTVRVYCNEKKLHENFGWNSDRLTRAINVCKDLYKSQLMPGGTAMPGPHPLSALSSLSNVNNSMNILKCNTLIGTASDNN